MLYCYGLLVTLIRQQIIQLLSLWARWQCGPNMGQNCFAMWDKDIWCRCRVIKVDKKKHLLCSSRIHSTVQWTKTWGLFRRERSKCLRLSTDRFTLQVKSLQLTYNQMSMQNEMLLILRLLIITCKINYVYVYKRSASKFKNPLFNHTHGDIILKI